MKILFICIALVLGGCTSGRPSVSDTQIDEARFYREKCGKCHLAHRPDILTFDQWESIVVHMEDKRSTPLTSDEKEIILNYLREHAKN